MPAKPTHPYWVERIRVIAINARAMGQRINTKRIAEVLEAEWQTLPRDIPPPPAPRTIDNYVTQALRLDAASAQEYTLVRWPQSFMAGALPWEAARPVLDYLRLCDQQGLPRPTVRAARWFWRLRLAAPTLPDEDADRFARELAFAHTPNPPAEIHRADLEWRLAYEPWKGGDRLAAYQQAAARHGLPQYPTSVSTGFFGSVDAVQAYFEQIFGGAAAQQVMPVVRDAVRQLGELREERSGETRE